MSPKGEQDEQGLSQWLVAPELVPEPGGDHPGENPHRDGRRRPDPEDLGERVLPDGCIPINLVGRLFHHRSIVREPNINASVPNVGAVMTALDEEERSRR